MKDHVEIDHLTKYDALRMKRDQVMDLEIWLKIHTNVSNIDYKIFKKQATGTMILLVYVGSIVI